MDEQDHLVLLLLEASSSEGRLKRGQGQNQIKRTPVLPMNPSWSLFHTKGREPTIHATATAITEESPFLKL